MDEQEAGPQQQSTSDEGDAPTPETATEKSDTAVQDRSRGRRWKLVLIGVVLTVAVVLARSYVEVHRPVDAAVDADSRNGGVELSARFDGYWNSSVLVLDLVRAKNVAPSDIFRVLFQAAEAMHRNDRRFESVNLASRGETVFILSGADFATLGEQFAGSENPVYMIRTLPSKLKRPDGTDAYSELTGGWLGVMTREMEDANKAARSWVEGSTAR